MDPEHGKIGLPRAAGRVGKSNPTFGNGGVAHAFEHHIARRHVLGSEHPTVADIDRTDRSARADVSPANLYRRRNAAPVCVVTMDDQASDRTSPRDSNGAENYEPNAKPRT